jgi:hypothetical protein
MTSANRAALPVNLRRTRAFISSGSQAACAGIYSRRTLQSLKSLETLKT